MILKGESALTASYQECMRLPLNMVQIIFLCMGICLGLSINH